MYNSQCSQSAFVVRGWDRQSCSLKSSVHLQNRSKKLIQESDQHLKDTEKITQKDKWYLVLDYARGEA